jgi:uncharacterized protein YciI
MDKFFVVYAIDKQNMADVRNACRPGHRARLRLEHALAKPHVGGPMLDAAGGMIGTMLVVAARSTADVEAYLAEDPYVLAGLYENVAIHEYAWGLGAPLETPAAS